MSVSWRHLVSSCSPVSHYRARDLADSTCRQPCTPLALFRRETGSGLKPEKRAALYTEVQDWRTQVEELERLGKAQGKVSAARSALPGGLAWQTSYVNICVLYRMSQYHNRQNLSSTILAHSAYFMLGFHNHKIPESSLADRRGQGRRQFFLAATCPRAPG